MTSNICANEIISTREFDAPLEQVFQAWTNPKHLARWWGLRASPIHFMNLN